MYRKSPSKIWRKFDARYSLIGSKSKKSGKIFFPPVLTDNGVTEFSIEKMPEEAKLVTWSRVESPPDGFEKFKPYIVGILEFENGERLTTQIVDVEYENLQKGDILIPTFRKYYEDGDDGVIQYGLKWTKV